MPPSASVTLLPRAATLPAALKRLPTYQKKADLHESAPLVPSLSHSAVSAEPAALSTLPDNAMLNIIAACSTRHAIVPELKAVRGLCGLCKVVQQQLCRLRPIVRVRVGSIGVAQRLSWLHKRQMPGKGNLPLSGHDRSAVYLSLTAGRLHCWPVVVAGDPWRIVVWYTGELKTTVVAQVRWPLAHACLPRSLSLTQTPAPIHHQAQPLHTLSLAHCYCRRRPQAKQAGVRSIDVLRSATLAHDAVPPGPPPPPPSPASSPASPASSRVVARRVAAQLLGSGGAQATSLLKLKLEKVAAEKAAANAADQREASVETLTVRLERGPMGFGMVLNSSNRLTLLVPEGPAAQSRLLREWDRITKVDGLELTGYLAAVAKGKDAMILTVERPPERDHDGIIAMEAAGRRAPFGSDLLLEKTLRSASTPEPSLGQLQLDDQLSPPIMDGCDQTPSLATEDGDAESIELLSGLLVHGALPELRLPALQALYLALSDAEWAEEDEGPEEEAPRDGESADEAVEVEASEDKAPADEAPADEELEDEAPSLHSSSWSSSSSSAQGMPSFSPSSSPPFASPPAAAHEVAVLEAEVESKAEVEAEVGALIDPSVEKLLARRDGQV